MLLCLGDVGGMIKLLESRIEFEAVMTFRSKPIKNWFGLSCFGVLRECAKQLWLNNLMASHATNLLVQTS